MRIQSEIDETLGWLGSVEPRKGLEQRIQQRLGIPRRRRVFSRMRIVYVGALAASVALSAVVVNPALRSMVFHPHGSAQNAPLNAPRVVAPSVGGFGTASAVHVPVEPVPVQPTPLNQGRGRSRSGRAVLPDGTLAPLPRGVAAPHTPAMAGSTR